MPYNDYRTDLMGSVTLSPTGQFQVGTYQTFTPPIQLANLALMIKADCELAFGDILMGRRSSLMTQPLPAIPQ